MQLHSVSRKRMNSFINKSGTAQTQTVFRLLQNMQSRKLFLWNQKVRWKLRFHKMHSVQEASAADAKLEKHKNGGKIDDECRKV